MSNFHPHKVVDRYRDPQFHVDRHRDPQLHVGENLHKITL